MLLVGADGEDLAGGLSYLSIERHNAATLHLRLRALPQYYVSAPETLDVTLPATALRSDAPLRLSAPLALLVNSTNGRPSLSGSLLRRASLVETSVQLEHLVLRVTLADDLWRDPITEPMALEIASSISAAPDSARGWQAVVQPALTLSNISRVNDTVLDVAVVTQRAYDLWAGAPELLSIALPASAVRQEVLPDLVVEPATCTVGVEGSLAGAQESALREGTRLVVVLSGCTWRTDVGADGAAQALLFGGLLSRQAEPSGFNALVHGNSSGGGGSSSGGGGGVSFSMVNASAVALAFAPLPTFDIVSPETVDVSINSSLVAFGEPVAAIASFGIHATPGTLQVRVDTFRLGPLRPSASLTEAALQSRENTLLLSLVNDTWVSPMSAAVKQRGRQAARARRRALRRGRAVRLQRGHRARARPGARRARERHAARDQAPAV